MITDELKGWLGSKLRGISYNIDLAQSCVLRCPSCAVGSIGGRKPYLMPLDTFKRFLDKAQSESKIRHIQLYIYSDPCQHPLLHLFLKECTERGIKTWISTMLQTTFCNFEKVIEARPTEFRISMPGWKHMRYYQGGAKVERFDKKFQEVVRLPRYPETTWTMAYHVYRDNQDEIGRARNLAERNGIKFVALPSIFMPMEVYVEGSYSMQDREVIGRMLETPEEATSRMKHSDYCQCFKQVALDAHLKVYLCQLIYRQDFVIAQNFLATPLKELMARQRRHEFCGLCMAKKGNQYQACYSEFVSADDPIADANKKRMP